MRENDVPSDRSKQELDLLLLERYVAGTVTGRDRAAVEAWLGNNPDRHQILDEMRRVWAHAATPPELFDSRAAWANVAERWDLAAGWKPPLRDAVSEEGGRSEALTRSKGRWRNRFATLGESTPQSRWTLGVASALAACLLIAVSFYAGQVIAARSSSQGFRDFATPVASRATVTLVDGTQVVLAPASRLRVPKDFGQHHRSVELEGEAYFTVVHDPRHPFSVQAGTVVATDVGTEFDVRAYGDRSAVRVAVKNGAVDLTRRNQHGEALRLRPMDVTTIDTAGTLTTEHGVEPELFTAWTTGTLVFHDAPLETVLADLRRWYAIDVRVTDSAFGSTVVTANWSSESSEVVLHELTGLLRARLERTGRVWKLVRLPRQTFRARGTAP